MLLYPRLYWKCKALLILLTISIFSCQTNPSQKSSEQRLVSLGIPVPERYSKINYSTDENQTFMKFNIHLSAKSPNSYGELRNLFVDGMKMNGWVWLNETVENAEEIAAKGLIFPFLSPIIMKKDKHEAIVFFGPPSVDQSKFKREETGISEIIITIVQDEQIE